MEPNPAQKYRFPGVAAYLFMSFGILFLACVVVLVLYYQINRNKSKPRNSCSDMPTNEPLLNDGSHGNGGYAGGPILLKGNLANGKFGSVYLVSSGGRVADHACHLSGAR